MSPPVWRDEPAVCVVMAAKGYPGAPAAGGEIAGLEGLRDALVFHAGTKRDAGGTLRAAGGRVLNVCASGADLAQARDRAYAAVDAIHFPDGFCRRDIAAKALPQ
jgi:phosphoribosylamine--glycine ligase